MLNRLTCRSSMLAVLLAATLGLAACDRSQTPSAEVAARVNGQEIAVRGDPGKTPDASVLNALDKLIDQELLVQKAVEHRLDRDPAVLQQIEDVRRQILAKTYVDRNITAAGATTAEIHAFYRAHPSLFEHRRLFRVDELHATVDAGTLVALRARVAQGDTLDAITDWLRDKQHPVRRVAAQRTAEQLPATTLERLSGMAPGQTSLVEAGNGITVTQLVQIQEMPLSLDEAKPLIGELLAEQRRQEIAANTAKQLRMQARIEYLGAFAEARKNADAGPVRQTAIGWNPSRPLRPGLL